MSTPARADGGIELKEFPLGGALGISGIAQGPESILWAVPERDRRLLRIEPGGHVATIPITGVPEGTDLESLALVGGATLAVGTETKEERQEDAIYFGLVSSTGLALQKRFVFDYRAFSLRASRNAGIEALCAAGGHLVAGSELVLEKEGRRLAPLMVYDLRTGRSRRHWVALTSATGKLAGMTCRQAPRGEGVEALAIERHFGVSVLLRFVVPTSPASGGEDRTLVPEVVFDLGARLETPPNFEGIEWVSRDEVVLVSDNQYGGTIEKTQVVRLPLPLHNRAE